LVGEKRGNSVFALVPGAREQISDVLPEVGCGWSVSGVVTGGSSGSGRLAPTTASAAAGKMSTDNRPAATSADAVTAGMAWIATPIDAAVTMTGSEVACSSPAATAPRLPTVRT